MKKTKKMLAAMLAVSTLAAALSGCSGGNKTDGSLEFTEAASADGNNGTTEAGASESSEAKTDPNGEKPSPEGYGILREASTAKIGSLNPLLCVYPDQALLYDFIRIFPQCGLHCM